MNILALNLPIWGDLLHHFGAVFLRISAMVSLLPAFGERSVPIRIKICLAIMFTAIVGASQTEEVRLSFDENWPVIITIETTIGLALGLCVRLFVLALQMAGTIAGQVTSLSQILGTTGEPVAAIGHILVIAGLAVAVTSGLHVRATHFMVQSYFLLPFGQWPDPRLLSAFGVQRISDAFSLAFLLAAPFAIVSVVYNLMLGVINRAMPQLMVAFVGAPAVTLGSILVLFLCASALLGVWLQALLDFLDIPVGWFP